MADFCIREVRETTPPLLDAFAALMPQLSAGLEAPSAAALERIVRSPSAAMFAAWRDGAAVGALTLVWYDVPSGRKGWIEDVVVDASARGAGFGYYSLSSIFIADLRGPELATVALLCNVMREIFTLLAAPLVARRAGPLAAVSIGGATTFDTTLPVITRAAGAPYAVVSISHGCVLDFSVPFLVTFFCTL